MEYLSDLLGISVGLLTIIQIVIPIILGIFSLISFFLLCAISNRANDIQNNIALTDESNRENQKLIIDEIAKQNDILQEQNQMLKIVIGELQTSKEK